MKVTPQSIVRGAVERADTPDNDPSLVVMSAAEPPPVLAGHLTPERGRAERFTTASPKC